MLAAAVGACQFVSLVSERKEREREKSCCGGVETSLKCDWIKSEINRSVRRK